MELRNQWIVSNIISSRFLNSSNAAAAMATDDWLGYYQSSCPAPKVTDSSDLNRRNFFITFFAVVTYLDVILLEMTDVSLFVEMTAVTLFLEK